MDIYDDFFEVKQMSDGFYIEVFSQNQGGKKVELRDVENKLKELKIDYDVDRIKEGLENIKENSVFQVTDLLTSENAESDDKEILKEKLFVLRVSTDHMTLYIKFLSSSDKNNIQIDSNEIIEEALRIKIAIKIDPDELARLLENYEYNKEYAIAKGIPVQEGEEAKIIYHFKMEKDLRPKVDEDGNVNYHQLHVISNVKKDQLLATLVHGKEGIPGRDLFGNEVKPKKVKLVKLPRGKNIYINDEQTEIYANINGLVKVENGKIIVHNIYEVPGNVGTSTGDIEFQGSMVISGNVTNGFKVIVKGDIEVMGIVEGAILEAGGNILLHRGVQGMNRCIIKADGNVTARFIENAEVIAGGNIYSEAILHSNVTAKGIIKVEGKKGMITGGSIRSGIEISAITLGSHMGTATNIEVGMDPLIWDEYNELTKNLPKLIIESEKLDQVVILLNRRKELAGDLDDAKKEMLVNATRNKIFIANKISVAQKRLEELRIEVECRNDGKIKVRNIIYPGVKISIGTAKYYVRDEIKYVTMIKEGADVKVTAFS